MHTKNLKRFRDGISGCRAFPPRGIGKSPIDVLERIGEYSQKDLSFEHDALNAFLGIFHAFKRAGVLAHHISGVPSVQIKQTDQPKLGKPIESLAPGLSWVADSRNENTYLKRREKFPSWSWAGWSGVGLRYWYFLMDRMYQINNSMIDMTVEVENENGQLMPWTASDSLKIFPRRIYITGWTTQLRIIKTDGRGFQGWALDAPGANNQLAKLHLTADPTEDLLLERALIEQLWTCLILSWSWMSTGPVLILKATKEGTFERIGIGRPHLVQSKLKVNDKEAFIGSRKFTRQRLILE
jgi:hypothetical protein